MKLSPLLLGLALPLITSVASAETLSVKTPSANFREQPSEKGNIVYSADKFYPVEVIERKNGWALVRDFEGDKAWVTEHALAKQQTIVIQSDHANIREKATTDGEVLFKVEHGEVFKVQERKDHWLKVVDAHGDGGWIRSDMTWGIEGEKNLDEKADPKDPKSHEKGKADEKGKTDKSEHSEKVRLDRDDADSKSDCPCRKAEEEHAQKKVDLTDKKTSDSKAKSADAQKDHKKLEHGKTEHSKVMLEKNEKSEKVEHARYMHDAKGENAKSDHPKANHRNHSKVRHDKNRDASSTAHHKVEKKSDKDDDDKKSDAK